MSEELPFKTRRDFTEGREWGEVSPGLRRFLLARPRTPDARPGGLVGATGVAHSSRCTLLLWVAGGHIPASHEEVAAAATAAAASSLQVRSQSPRHQVQEVVSWLENQQASGLLRNAYVTASLAVVVDDQEVWVWHTSPHGAMCGPLDGLRVSSTDLRTPTLRDLSVLPAPTLSSSDAQFVDNLSSIFCVGTPDGYEEVRCDIGGDRA